MKKDLRDMHKDHIESMMIRLGESRGDPERQLRLVTSSVEVLADCFLEWFKELEKEDEKSEKERK